jgi:hypothetical protein
MSDDLVDRLRAVNTTRSRDEETVEEAAEEIELLRIAILAAKGEIESGDMDCAWRILREAYRRG